MYLVRQHHPWFTIGVNHQRSTMYHDALFLHRNFAQSKRKDRRAMTLNRSSTSSYVARQLFSSFGTTNIAIFSNFDQQDDISLSSNLDENLKITEKMIDPETKTRRGLIGTSDLLIILIKFCFNACQKYPLHPFQRTFFSHLSLFTSPPWPSSMFLCNDWWTRRKNRSFDFLRSTQHFYAFISFNLSNCMIESASFSTLLFHSVIPKINKSKAKKMFDRLCRCLLLVHCSKSNRDVEEMLNRSVDLYRYKQFPCEYLARLYHRKHREL